MNTRINEIINDLRGTCKELDDVLENYGLTDDDLSMEDFDHIDQNIMQCEHCGWWNSTTEMVGVLCRDCEKELSDD